VQQADKKLMELEEELERFVEFGGLLDKKTRRYMVSWMREQFRPKQELPPLNNQYFNYFKKELSQLFLHEDLLELGTKSEVLSLQIIRDIVRWFRQLHDKTLKKHPHEEELTALGGWSVRPLPIVIETWRSIIRQVALYYTSEEFDTTFYENRWKQLINGQPATALAAETKEAVEFLFLDFLSQWDAKLQGKILAFQLKNFEEEFQDFQQTLTDKIQEFKKLNDLLSPFTDYLERYWDLSRSLWEDTNFDVLQDYDVLLQNEEQIRKLAETLGRMRQAELETQEESFETTIVRKSWVKDPLMRTEVSGIELSNRLQHTLASEIALLSESATTSLFLKNWADNRLLTTAYDDKKLVISNDIHAETHSKVKQKEKGPFIICVDTSGSMEGEPERIAKVLCFAILKMANEDQRRAYLINFSQGIKTLDLLQIADSLDEVAHFLKMSFRGGTDISLALNEALTQLETHQYKDADVLVISDFIMYKISEDLLQRMEKQQFNKGTQFHNLTISEQGNQEVIDKFDNNWLYNLDTKNIERTLHENLTQIRNRRL